MRFVVRRCGGSLVTPLLLCTAAFGVFQIMFHSTESSVPSSEADDVPGSCDESSGNDYRSEFGTDQDLYRALFDRTNYSDKFSSLDDVIPIPMQFGDGTTTAVRAVRFPPKDLDLIKSLLRTELSNRDIRLDALSSENQKRLVGNYLVALSRENPAVRSYILTTHNENHILFNHDSSELNSSLVPEPLHLMELKGCCNFPVRTTDSTTQAMIYHGFFSRKVDESHLVDRRELAQDLSLGPNLGAIEKILKIIRNWSKLKLYVTAPERLDRAYAFEIGTPAVDHIQPLTDSGTQRKIDGSFTLSDAENRIFNNVFPADKMLRCVFIDDLLLHLST